MHPKFENNEEKIIHDEIRFKINRNFIISAFLYTILCYAIISVAAFSLNVSSLEFLRIFVHWELIGICTLGTILASFYLFKPKHILYQLGILTLAITVGSLIGIVVGYIITTGFQVVSPFHIIGINRDLISSIVLGYYLTGTFVFIAHHQTAEMMFVKEKIKRQTIEKKVAEMSIKMLQAQIEPHFLFNTLSITRSLLDINMEKGKQMLEDLNEYLQALLLKARQETTTISQEMDIIRAYLNIFKIRMGDRLAYTIDISDKLEDHPFPSMLIQPIVENAIKHGIEMNVEGGIISISACRQEDLLKVEICDTGSGLGEMGSSGFGLANIRERLNALYGERGRLFFEENTPSGLKVVIEVPYAK